jgi:curved DNA-binding protein
VAEAYEVLKDPEKRKKYDTLGANWKQYQDQGSGGRGFDWSGFGGGYGGGTRVEFDGNINDIFGGGGFSDFFQNFFGGGFSDQRTGSRQGGLKGQDYEAGLAITLEEAYNGTHRMLETDGSKLRIRIKPGVQDGQVLRIKQKGGKGVRGGEPGDIYLKVSVSSHSEFERQGNDLFTDLNVDLFTAVLGGKARVKTFRGEMEINIPEGVENGKKLRLKGLGMPDHDHPTNFGDLYARINVVLPKKLNPEEKALFRKLAEMRHYEGVK